VSPRDRGGPEAGGAGAAGRPGRLPGGRILAAAGAVALLLTEWLFPEHGRLEVVDLVVDNASSVLDVTPAVIDVRVQNTGSRRVVAKRVTLVIKEVVTVNVCATEGEIPITGTYDVSVPLEPSPGDALEHTLDQQIAADEVDRFLIRLQNPETAIARSLSIYVFRVQLETNGQPETIDAGAVVVSLPVLPDNQLAAWYWGSRWVTEPLDWLGSRQASTEECLHTNSGRLRTILEHSGRRSAELSAVEGDLR
jgi:hypothetical protein